MAEEIIQAAAQPQPQAPAKPKKVKVILTGGGSCFIENTLFKKGVEREVSSSVADTLLKTGLFVKK